MINIKKSSGRTISEAKEDLVEILEKKNLDIVFDWLQGEFLNKVDAFQQSSTQSAPPAAKPEEPKEILPAPSPVKIVDEEPKAPIPHKENLPPNPFPQPPPPKEPQPKQASKASAEKQFNKNNKKPAQDQKNLSKRAPEKKEKPENKLNGQKDKKDNDRTKRSIHDRIKPASNNHHQKGGPQQTNKKGYQNGNSAQGGNPQEQIKGADSRPAMPDDKEREAKLAQLLAKSTKVDLF